MKNWRTNLGGAIAIVGTALISIGTLSQFTQLSPDSKVLTPHQLSVMWYVALVGFILAAVGKGIAFLFAADAKEVQNIKDQINQTPQDPTK